MNANLPGLPGFAETTSVTSLGVFSHGNRNRFPLVSGGKSRLLTKMVLAGGKNAGGG